MLRDSIAVVVVVCTRPLAIPLAMITRRKSTRGFPLLSHMSMGLRLANLRAAGALLLFYSVYPVTNLIWENARGIYFHVDYLTNRFHVAVHLSSNRSQMTSKCGKNKKVAHEAIAECVTDVLTTF